MNSKLQKSSFPKLSALGLFWGGTRGGDLIEVIEYYNSYIRSCYLAPRWREKAAKTLVKVLFLRLSCNLSLKDKYANKQKGNNLDTISEGVLKACGLSPELFCAQLLKRPTKTQRVIALSRLSDKASDNTYLRLA